MRVLTSSGTIKSTLDRHNGVGPGFDLLRLGLAAAIFYCHAKWAAAGLPSTAASAHLVSANPAGAYVGFKRPLYVALVPMFFALSGFLVLGSAFRLRDVRPFLVFRSLRIFPALSVEVLLSAFILGPLFTSLAAFRYFTDPEFARYFGNIFGFVTFLLPGVFDRNPIPHIVNINLWTLPAEFYCYLLTTLGMVTGVIYNRKLLTGAFVVVTIVFLAMSLGWGFGVTGATYPTPVVTYYFFVGCLFYLWRDRIPCGVVWLVPVAALTYGLLLFQSTVFIAPLLLTYMTVLIGTMRLPRPALIRKGDYSYGIYLYGFPITQAVLASFPALRGHGWEVVLIAGAITTAFAVTSWHLIERPTLGLKRHFARAPAPAGARATASFAASNALSRPEAASVRQPRP
jgi:peptidoglycan/LPS O-acetylase OafA/YrhL